MVPKQRKFIEWTSKRYLIIIVFFVLFYFFFNLIYTDIKNKTKDDFVKEQLLLAKTAAQGISTLLATYQSDLTFIAKYAPVIDLSTGYKKCLIDYYKMHSNTLDAITRVNASGRIVYTYPYMDSVIGQDISWQDHMIKIFATHKPVISDIFMSVQGYNTIAIHVPVFKDKEFNGSLALLIPLNKIGNKFLDNIGDEKNGHSWLISENLFQIYCRIPGHEGASFIQNTMSDVNTLELIDKIKGSENGTGFSTHQDFSGLNTKKAEKKFVVYQRIPLGSTYWTILISFDEAEIYSSLSKFRLRSTVFLFILFIAVIIYVFSLAKVSNIMKGEAQRKKAERLLKKSEQKFRALVENNPFPMWIADKNGILQDANKALKAILNLTDEDLVGKYSVLKDENLQNDELSLKIKSVFNEQKTVDFTLLWEANKIKHIDLSRAHDLWINVTLFPLLNEKNEITNIVCQWIDISEKIIAEKELISAKEKAEESDHLKSAFLANMSHEIRTPMNGILGFTGLLKKPNLTGEEEKRYINIIEQSGQRMLDTLQNIIDISKIESGQEKISLSDVDLGLLTQELLDFFQPEAQENNLRLSISKQSTDHKINIKTDKDKLNSILTNLIKNALKYTHEGSIEFGCTKEANDQLKFYVKDSGIGIPVKRQNAIFNRFEQADIEDKNVYEGSGLGLSITKAYVEMLGGNIWVESIEKSGSIFYFTLPYNPAVETIVHTDNKKHEDFTTNKPLKILIVEDEEFAATYLNILLEDFAKEIFIANNGLEAVETCKNNPDLDLVLMDIKLPKMNGLTATQKIREFNKDILIIAQTAFAQMGDREKCLNAGCNDFISKPIEKDNLFGLINKYLGANKR